MTSTTSTPPGPSAPLQITLWVLQVLLGVFFLLAGYTHGLVPIEQAAKSVPWITSVPVALARFIGIAEMAGGVGLVLPAATRVAPWLTPLAALGLAVIMLLAAVFHIMRGEASVIGFHIVVGALAAFVAWGRWRRQPSR